MRDNCDQCGGYVTVENGVFHHEPDCPVSCNSCEMLSINGLPCHETGCPNSWCGTKECKWCGQAFQPESRWQECCSDDCKSSYNGTPGDESEFPLPEVGVDDIELLDSPGEPQLGESPIEAIGRVLGEEDPVFQVDDFNSRFSVPPLNNGIWWGMNSWREKVPKGYVAQPCQDCGKPVAKPSTITESVSCEFCEPPEIL